MRVMVASCAAALSILLNGGALAFDAAAPDPGDAAARSARSIECSQKADAQDLHGKPRKHFMRECKHAK